MFNVRALHAERTEQVLDIRNIDVIENCGVSGT